MLILAVDTALAACSACLYDTTAGEVLAERVESMQRGHAEHLAPMVNEVMRQSGRSYAEIGRAATSCGPGTFTGVRIGISFVRGLSLALGCPAVGISTLNALAGGVQSVANGRPIVALIDARREAVYAQAFSSQLAPLNDPAAVLVPEIASVVPKEETLAVGSGASLAAHYCPNLIIHNGDHLPRTDIIARLAALRDTPKQPPTPLYLRAADAKEQVRSLKLSAADVTITSVDASHGAVLSAIHAECFPKPWTEKDIGELLEMPGTRAFLACRAKQDHQPLAFLIARHAAGEAEIITLATRPAARRRKAATSLLDHAVATLQAHRVTVLHLEVDEVNEAAQSFYKAAGFIESGRRKGYYTHPDGTRTDAITMQRTM